MASPLILRIAVKSDDAPLDATNQKLRAFQGEVTKASITAQGSKEQIKQFVEQVKKMGDESTKTGTSMTDMLGKTSKEIRGLVMDFILFRRAATIFGIISAPILLAQKGLIELDAKIKPLNASLAQLGTTSQIQSTQLINFIRTLTAGTSTSIAEGVGALTVFVNKTKSTIDIEKTLAAAHTLAMATGMKFADATSAITDALNGDATALSNVTLKTKEQINELARSGQLAKVIQDSYKDAAQTAQSGAFEFWKKVGSDFSKAFTQTSGFNPLLAFSRSALQGQQEIAQVLKSVVTFKQTLQDLASAKINFSSIDDLRITIGKLNGAIEQAKVVISTGLATPSQIGAATRFISIAQEQIKILQQQKMLEQQLSSPERERLKTQALLAGLQADLFSEQNRSLATINESNESLAKQKSIRADILKAQLDQIHAESISQARQILSQGKGITPEQQLAIATQEIQKKNQAVEASYKLEADNNLKILDSDTKLQHARLDLQKFYLENRIRQYSGTTAEQAYRVENQFVEKEVQFAIDAAKREAMQLLSEHRLTASEETRIETELQLKLSQIRKDAEDNREKETQARLGRLSQPQQDRVKQLVSQFAKNGGTGLWTEKAELDKYKKISDEKVEIAKNEEAALVKYFGEETRVAKDRASIPGDVIGQLQDMVKKARSAAAGSKDLEKLSDEFKSAFTPDEKAALAQISSLRDSAEALMGKKPIKVPVEFTTVVDINSVVRRIVDEVQRQLINGNAASVYKEGAEQGGSES